MSHQNHRNKRKHSEESSYSAKAETRTPLKSRRVNGNGHKENKNSSQSSQSVSSFSSNHSRARHSHSPESHQSNNQKDKENDTYSPQDKDTNSRIENGTHKETHRERNKETYRERDNDTYSHKDTRRDKYKYSDRDKYTYSDQEKDTHRSKYTYSERDKDTHKKRDKETHRYKDRDTYSHSGSSSDRGHSSRRVIKNDKEGHLMYQEGDVLNDYKLIQTLGQGTFGKVVETKDLRSGERVALKIVRNVAKYRDSALTEVDILKRIHRCSSKGKMLCARLLDWFEWHGHVCISFDLLGKSIFDFLKRNYYYPYPMDQIRQIAYQLTRGVKFLHDNRLTHTDLKPENILFIDSASEVYKVRRIRNKDREIRRVKCADIQIIDFGSATFEHDHHSRVVSTRHYRAPEVVLELGWSHACDVWSIGCILFELYTGHTMFQTHDNLEHLAMMQRILGSMPSSMALKSHKSKFFHKGVLAWKEESEDGIHVHDSCKPLHRYMRSASASHTHLFHLITSMLHYKPSHRIHLQDALQHPFFS